MAIQKQITFKTRAERAIIESLAIKAGLSFSNYARRALGLELLGRGGARPNTGRKNPKSKKRKPE